MSRFSLISINAIYFFDSLHIASMLSNCTVKCEGVKGVLCCNTGFLAVATVKILNTAYWKACWDLQYLKMQTEMITRTIPRPAAPLPITIGMARLGTVRKELDQKWWRILRRISFYKYFWRANFHRHLLSAKCSFNLTSVVPKSPVRLHWNNPGIVQFDHQDAETMSQILTSFQKQLVANLFLTNKMMLVCWMTHDSDNYKTFPCTM